MPLSRSPACARLILRIAPDARVVPIRIFGEGLETSPGTLHSAILWAIEQQLDVVCVSGALRYPETIRPLYAACEKGRRNGMIFVSGGRPAPERTDLAIFEPVIGVMEGSFDSPFDFHYYPDAGYEVEAWGEGEFIGADGSHETSHSPELAAAGVAGIVALLRQHFPDALVERIRELLQRFAV